MQVLCKLKLKHVLETSWLLLLGFRENQRKALPRASNQIHYVASLLEVQNTISNQRKRHQSETE